MRLCRPELRAVIEKEEGVTGEDDDKFCVECEYYECRPRISLRAGQSITRVVMMARNGSNANGEFICCSVY